jgi:DNA polymerase III alpha subunit
MIFEINICNELTDTEQGKILSSNIQFKDLNEAIQYLLDNQFITKRRLKAVVDLSNSLKFPAYSLIDGPEWISDVEDRALGCAITCSKLDLYDISMTNCSCRDFKNGNQKKVIIGGEIEYLNVTKTKTGKAKGSDMCFINLVDSTGSLDNVIFFPDQYKKYKNMLFTGNIIILFGNRSQSGDGLVVEKAYVAKT